MSDDSVVNPSGGIVAKLQAYSSVVYNFFFSTPLQLAYSYRKIIIADDDDFA